MHKVEVTKTLRMAIQRVASVPSLIFLLSIILLDPSLGQPSCPTSWSGASQFGVPSYFYEFDPDNDNVVPVNDDGYSPEIQMSVPFPFFGEYHETLYVNTNGVLSFRRGYGTYTPEPFPLADIFLIAPYWADVNTRANYGRIYYRQTTQNEVLCRASQHISTRLGRFSNFQAVWAFIATWYEVTFFGGSPNTPVNTFQVILATDGRYSFSIFKYGSITWTSGGASGGDENGLGGTPAQVGFNANSVNSYALSTSRTPEIVNIDTDPSNTGDTGCWLFQVDSEEITDSAGCTVQGSVTLSPDYGQYLGGKKIYISGPCYNESSVQIVCKFDGEEVDGMLLDQRVALCITPMINKIGNVEFSMSVNGGWTFNFTASYYAVRTDENSITRVNDEQWLSPPYLPLSYTWDSTLYPADANLQVDLLILDRINDTQKLVNILPSTPNDGEETMPSALMFTTPLEEFGYIGAIRISQTDESALPVNLWSDVHPLLWYDVALMDELINRAQHEEILNVREREIYEKMFELHQTVSPNRQIPRTIIERLINKFLTAWVGEAYCYNWYYQESQYPPMFEEEVESPPCTEDQAASDGGYKPVAPCDRNQLTAASCKYFQGSADICYHSKKPTISGYGQQVCYNPKGWKKKYTFAGAGTYDRSHYSIPFDHIANDLLPYVACCKTSCECSKYYQYRWTDKACSLPPPVAWFGGDPHFSTFEYVEYTFNGFGEYWVMNHASLSIQARFEPFYSITDDGTFITSISIQAGDTRVQYRVLLNELIVDALGHSGELLTIQEYEINGNVRLTRLTMTHIRQTTYFTVGSTECRQTMDVTAYRKWLSAQLRVFPPSCFQGEHKGLLGNSINGLVSPDGIIVPADSSLEDIHNLFGEKWRITEEESIFSYSIGTTYEDYQDPTYTPVFYDQNSLLRRDDGGLCGESLACRYDLFVAGDFTVAFTLKAVQNIRNSAQLFQEGKSPCFPQPCGDKGLCEEIDETYECYCIAGYSGANCEIRLDICSSQPCVNNGICQPKNAGNTFHCLCPVGFAGEFCGEVSDNLTNICHSSPCQNGGTCFKAGVCDFVCFCDTGYSGKTCEDTPCASDPCNNGGYCYVYGDQEMCSCPTGFSGIHCHISKHDEYIFIGVSVGTFAVLTLLLLCVLERVLLIARRCEADFHASSRQTPKFNRLKQNYLRGPQANFLNRQCRSQDFTSRQRTTFKHVNTRR